MKNGMKFYLYLIVGKNSMDTQTRYGLSVSNKTEEDFRKNLIGEYYDETSHQIDHVRVTDATENILEALNKYSPEEFDFGLARIQDKKIKELMMQRLYLTLALCIAATAYTAFILPQVMGWW